MKEQIYMLKPDSHSTEMNGVDMSDKSYAPNTRGKCPYCKTIVRFDYPAEPSSNSKEGKGVAYVTSVSRVTDIVTESGSIKIVVYASRCPNCDKPIISATIYSKGGYENRLLIPPNIIRIAPPEVPKEIQDDFHEAAAVLHISEKASAALSRRCLQNLLSDRGFKGRDLIDQIDKVLPHLSGRLAENLDYIRNVGNFATHPNKSQTTGLIADVEPAEANWNLDVLEDLFEYFYVLPKRAAEKRDKLNQKLTNMGKPPIKKP